MEYQEVINRYLQLEQTDMRKKIFGYLLKSLEMFSQQHIVRKKLIELDQKTFQAESLSSRDQVLTRFYIEFLRDVKKKIIDNKNVSSCFDDEYYQKYSTSELKDFKYKKDLDTTVKIVYKISKDGVDILKAIVDFPENMSYYESFQLDPKVSLKEAFDEHFTSFFKDTILSNFFSSKYTPYLFKMSHIAQQLSEGIVQANGSKKKTVITHTGYDGWLKVRDKNQKHWQELDKEWQTIIAINAYCKHYLEGLKNG